MKLITRENLKKRIDRDDDTVVVEVLGAEQFTNYHLPGAVNVPIGINFEQNIQGAVPDKSRPIVVYCEDENCSASEKAASTLEELGYEQVYDYEAGKKDWKEAGYPIEN